MESKQLLTFLILLFSSKGFANNYAENCFNFNDGDPCANGNYGKSCVKLGQKFYLIVDDDRRNWQDASQFCRQQNGLLAPIKNEAELTLISDYLKAKQYNADKFTTDSWRFGFWIGLSNFGSETFYSIETDKPALFFKWNDGEPNNTGGNENCVHLWPEPVKMNDNDCNKKMYYICELKPVKIEF